MQGSTVADDEEACRFVVGNCLGQKVGVVGIYWAGRQGNWVGRKTTHLLVGRENSKS